MSKYDSILNYQYLMKHQRMTNNERAAQFAPFSALTGYNELILEKGRETSTKKEITDETKEILDYKLKIISDNLDKHPQVTITYFVKDLKKEGGSYKTVDNYFKKIDFYHKIIILENNDKIKIENITDINSLDIDLDDFLS